MFIHNSASFWLYLTVYFSISHTFSLSFFCLSVCLCLFFLPLSLSVYSNNCLPLSDFFLFCLCLSVSLFLVCLCIYLCQSLLSFFFFRLSHCLWRNGFVRKREDRLTNTESDTDRQIDNDLFQVCLTFMVKNVQRIQLCSRLPLKMTFAG